MLRNRGFANDNRAFVVRPNRPPYLSSQTGFIMVPSSSYNVIPAQPNYFISPHHQGFMVMQPSIHHKRPPRPNHYWNQGYNIDKPYFWGHNINFR